MTPALDSLIRELTDIAALPAIERGLALRTMLAASRPQSDVRSALREAMAELAKAGMSHGEIAKTQGVARQQIQRVLSGS